jgi:hypothetical protein
METFKRDRVGMGGSGTANFAWIAECGPHDKSFRL